MFHFSHYFRISALILHSELLPIKKKTNNDTLIFDLSFVDQLENSTYGRTFNTNYLKIDF